MNTRKTGQYYEDSALEHLQAQGYKIIKRNYRCRYGEIDIIARHQGYLAFIEVKYRKGDSSGGPFAAVDLRKQKKICKAARWYLMEQKLGDDIKGRFDVVGITPKTVEILQNAFDYIG